MRLNHSPKLPEIYMRMSLVQSSVPALPMPIDLLSKSIATTLVDGKVE